MITPTQMRAARAILDISQADAAKLLGIAPNTLSKIEGGQADPPASRIQEIQHYYESQGIEFLDGDGARRKQDNITILKGHKGFVDFIWDVHNVVKTSGGEICVSNVDEQDFLVWLGEDEAQKYKDAMAEINKNFYFKILICENDDYFAAGKYAEYKWVSKQEFSNVPFYVYGDRLAILLFDKEASVYIIKNQNIANAYRAQFNVLWDRALTPNVPGRLK